MCFRCKAQAKCIELLKDKMAKIYRILIETSLFFIRTVQFLLTKLIRVKFYIEEEATSKMETYSIHKILKMNIFLVTIGVDLLHLNDIKNLKFMR